MKAKLKIKDVIIVQSGLVLQRVKPKGNDQRKLQEVLSLKAFNGQRYFQRETDYTDTQEFIDFDSKCLTQENDILVRLRTPVEAILVTKEGIGIVVPSHVAILRIKEDASFYLHPKYFVHYFNSADVSARFDHHSKGSSMITMIKLKDLAEHELPEFPVFEQQEKLVKILDLMQEEIKFREKLTDLSKKKQTAILQRIFQSKKQQ